MASASGGRGSGSGSGSAWDADDLDELFAMSDRLIVMHGASYVSREAIKVLGRLGRSWGCPAVRREIADKIIDTIRGGSAIFAYYPEKGWLTRSAFVHRSVIRFDRVGEPTKVRAMRSVILSRRSAAKDP